MPFPQGTKLGSYENLSLIGAGGMGEVYRARDSKLGREVAIKVLPDAFIKDPERLARFEREARLLASLNHPHIGGIYGLEESNDARFLVLELVSGETLAGRLSKGALEFEEALKICSQVAEALEAAHEKGIIHRDLKPANIKVTPEGKVKVLDFGLAKAFAPEESSPSLSMSPTQTAASMQSGVILGTAPYMSPEQARGKPLDKRTDIWSFGCVLYGCLTGKQAFSGETVSDTIAKILEREPDLTALPPSLPANLRVLLNRCLQKDRNLRLHDIADARIELNEALAEISKSSEVVAARFPLESRATSRERFWMITAALSLVAFLVAVGVSDGRHFLYYARSGQRENNMIYVGSVDVTETKRLLSADSSVAYAPPGYLLFMRERMLMGQPFDEDKLQLSGEPFPVAEELTRFGETGPTGYGAFSTSQNGVLAYLGGTALNTQFLWFDRAGKQLGSIGPPGLYGNPFLSPDEKRLAVNRDDPKVGSADIFVIEISRGLASRFTFHPSSEWLPVWSPDGNRIVFASNREGAFNLYQKLSSGAGNDELLLKSNTMQTPSDWSLDGRFIIFSNVDPKTGYDLWFLPLFGDRKPKPFLATEFNEAHGVLSRDGRWMAYVSDESGRLEVYVRAFPQAGEKVQISTAGGDQPKWRRDGRELFYIAADKKLMAVEVNGAGPRFETGATKTLFETRVPTLGITDVRNSYVVTVDGQRFLINTLVSEGTGMPMTVVLNWTAGIRH